MWVLALMALVAVGVIAAVAVGSARSSASRAPPTVSGSARTCPVCGYDLSQIATGICPECGDSDAARNAARQATEQSLRSLDRLLVRLLLGGAILIAALFVAAWLLSDPR